MNTFNQYKTAILDTRNLIKEAKELAKSDTTTRSLVINVIFEARQLQHKQINLAKKEYPKTNWHSLI